MIIKNAVKFVAGLHLVEQRFLSAIVSQRCIHPPGGGVHRAECGERIENESNAGGTELLNRQQRRLAE